MKKKNYQKPIVTCILISNENSISVASVHTETTDHPTHYWDDIEYDGDEIKIEFIPTR